MKADNPIRVATACLSKRIYAGRATKDGMGLKDPRYDVTNDVYQAIRDHVGIGRQLDLSREDEPAFTIAVTATKPADLDYADDALSQELRALAFRLQCRADAGDNVAIGQALRAELESALTRAADALAAPDEARAIANQIHSLTKAKSITVKEMNLSEDGEMTDVGEGE